MKKLLLILLVSLAFKAEAQRNIFYKSFFGIKDSTIELAPLPHISEMDLYSHLVKMKGKAPDTLLNYVISNLDVYYQFYSDKKTDSLPEIDFSRRELYLRWYCVQCMAGCNHGEASNGNLCHRNRCSLMGIWVFRDKVYCGEPVAARKD